jgi:hypothetical protein
LLDICLFVSCVSINVLEMPQGGGSFLLDFGGFVLLAPKTMIQPYLGLYWSI